MLQCIADSTTYRYPPRPVLNVGDCNPLRLFRHKSRVTMATTAEALTVAYMYTVVTFYYDPMNAMAPKPFRRVFGAISSYSETGVTFQLVHDTFLQIGLIISALTIYKYDKAVYNMMQANVCAICIMWLHISWHFPPRRLASPTADCLHHGTRMPARGPHSRGNPL